MHILDTIKTKNSKSQVLNSKPYLFEFSWRNLNFSPFQIDKFRFWNLFRFLHLGFKIYVAICFIFLATGCVQKDDLKKAKIYAQQSQINYQRAVNQYKGLIRKGKDLDRLYFELGKLYYSHGDFIFAKETLEKTALKEAKKFLAICHYRLGNFTEALEIFNKNEPLDDEYLYYHGLTCEKLNLFDQALSIYEKIKAPVFILQAKERIKIIAQKGPLPNIKELDPSVAKIIAESGSFKDYPEAGALILFSDEKIEISAEDTKKVYLHYIIKILNERGKEDFAEAHIDYDSTYERVELEYARTIKPDGQVVQVSSRHIRDVSKYLNFPLYSNARVFIISFPEVTKDAVIEYKVKIYRSQLINKKDFALVYLVQADEPIINANFSIELPIRRNLSILTLNESYNNFGADLKPKIKKENDRLIYNWQFKNIPQIIPETRMPPDIEINPALIISTFSSWQEIYDWWWQLAKDKIKADINIKNKVKELIKDLESEEEKIKAIYNFCAKEIRYVAVEYGQAGYEPHKAEDTFNNKYGDCKDQTILLVTMLKEAGFLAYPVLIPTKGTYNLNPDFPSMLFNHVITAVSLNKEFIFLDPTAETCGFGDLPSSDQGRQVLIIKEDTYEIRTTPLYPAEHNFIKQSLKIKVNSDETINAKRKIFTFGVYDQTQRYWLLYTPPELIADTLKERIQEVSIGAKLKNYIIKNLDDLNQPVVLEYDFDGPEYFTSAGILRIMPQLAALDTSLVAKECRKYPLDFNLLDCKEIELEIMFPKEFRIKYLPKDITEDSHWLKFEVKYIQKDNLIIFKQKTQLKKTFIDQENYPDFKNFLETLAKKVKQRIILEKKR